MKPFNFCKYSPGDVGAGAPESAKSTAEQQELDRILTEKLDQAVKDQALAAAKQKADQQAAKEKQFPPLPKEYKGMQVDPQSVKVESGKQTAEFNFGQEKNLNIKGKIEFPETGDLSKPTKIILDFKDPNTSAEERKRALENLEKQKQQLGNVVVVTIEIPDKDSSGKPVQLDAEKLNLCSDILADVEKYQQESGVKFKARPEEVLALIDHKGPQSGEIRKMLQKQAEKVKANNSERDIRPVQQIDLEKLVSGNWETTTLNGESSGADTGTAPSVETDGGAATGTDSGVGVGNATGGGAAVESGGNGGNASGGGGSENTGSGSGTDSSSPEATPQSTPENRETTKSNSDWPFNNSEKYEKYADSPISGATGLFGDSIFEGVAGLGKLNLPDGKSVFAERGKSTQWLLTEINRRKPEVQKLENAIILISTNDIGGADSAETIINRLIEIYSTLLDINPKLKIYACTIPPFAGYASGNYRSDFSGVNGKRELLNKFIENLPATPSENSGLDLNKITNLKKLQDHSSQFTTIPLHKKLSEGGISADDDANKLGLQSFDHLHPDSRELGKFINAFVVNKQGGGERTQSIPEVSRTEKADQGAAAPARQVPADKAATQEVQADSAVVGKLRLPGGKEIDLHQDTVDAEKLAKPYAGEKSIAVSNAEMHELAELASFLQRKWKSEGVPINTQRVITWRGREWVAKTAQHEVQEATGKRAAPGRLFYAVEFRKITKGDQLV